MAYCDKVDTRQTRSAFLPMNDFSDRPLASRASFRPMLFFGRLHLARNRDLRALRWGTLHIFEKGETDWRKTVGTGSKLRDSG